MRSTLIHLALLSLSIAAQAEPGFGPAPRDDEGLFLNDAGLLYRPGPDVTLPFFARGIWRSLSPRDGAASRVTNDGAWLRKNARHSVPTVTWVGHATLLVQMSHLSFLTDPMWSDRASPLAFAGPSRHAAPGVAINDLPPIDFVVISHNHYDHMDKDSLVALAARDPNTRFLVPLGNRETLQVWGVDNVTELDWGGSIRIGATQVHCLPAQHWSRRGIADGREALWSSWAVIGADRRFYFGGDTGYFDGLGRIGKALGPFDLAAVPIGAYEPKAMMQPVHLNPEEALRAAKDLRAARALAIHFGTFDLTDEPFPEPPIRFKAAAAAAGFSASDAWVLQIGETREF